MTALSEEQVRAWLESLSRPAIVIGGDVVVDTKHAEACYRAALALLDAGREDRERQQEALVVYRHAFVRARGA